MFTLVRTGPGHAMRTAVFWIDLGLSATADLEISEGSGKDVRREARCFFPGEHESRRFEKSKGELQWP